MSLACSSEAVQVDAGKEKPPAITIPDDGGSVGAFSVNAMLASLGRDCFIESFRELSSESELFSEVALEFQKSPTEENRIKAQEALVSLNKIWQRVELFQVGPLMPITNAGGQGLRSEFYSWPLVSGCNVDIALVNKKYELAEFATSTIKERGLDVMEYLLFNSSEISACDPSNAIITSGSFAAITAEDMSQRKADYLYAAAMNFQEQAEVLLNAWLPSEGAYLNEFAAAGNGSNVYASEAEVLNGLYDALFYTESELRELKLAEPLGKKDCLTSTCPEKVEFQNSNLSKAAIIANIQGIRDLLEGCGKDKYGFDDLLISKDAGALAEQMIQALDKVEAAANALPDDGVKADLAPEGLADQLYVELSTFVTLMRGEFATLLGLSVPLRGAADHD